MGFMEALMAGLLASAMAPTPVATRPAQATDGAGQRLGECLVLRSTGADRLVVARWFLGVMASTPQATDVTTLLPERKPALDRAMAALFTRLLVQDCAAESRPLFAAGGTAGFEVAGEALGRVAMAELLKGSQAQTALEAYTRYLKPEDFKPLAP